MLRVCKANRELQLWGGPKKLMFRAPIALGWSPVSPKRGAGDGKTPEGTYRICLIKEQGRHGQSLGLSYPNPADADKALQEGRIHSETHAAILNAHQEGCRPPWGSPLGGEIYIHGGGAHQDWTQGCIALEDDDMAQLFLFAEQIEIVEILP